MTIGICLAMVMYTFLPVTRVAAAEYGNGNYRLTVDVGTNELKNGSLQSVTVNENKWENNSDAFMTETGNNTIVVVVKAENG